MVAINNNLLATCGRNSLISGGGGLELERARCA